MLRSRTSVLVAVALALAAPLAAQSGKGKPAKPKKGEAAAAAAPEQPKDDPVTKKDKAIAAIDKFRAAHKVDPKRDGWRSTFAEPPRQEFDPQREYHWHLVTNKGELDVRLRPDVAPMHVTSVIYLSRSGFYDGLTFHRVIKGFMAQGGCPLGNGSGGPGYTMGGEFDPACKHDKAGVLSTANEEGKPRSDGSQFFLTFAPAPHLDGKHTIFGEVVEGLDVVKAIDACGGPMETGKSTEPLSIVRTWVTVVAKDGGADAKDEGDKGGKKDAGKDKPGKKGK